MRESHGGGTFEIGWMGTQFARREELFDERMDVSESFGKGFVADFLAIDADAFVDFLEMRRSVESSSQTSMAKDGFEKTVLQQEFGALKSFGEFLADGLLDHARTGKPDERAGFPDVEVAEHGEAGGDAAGGGIGEHRDIGQLFVVEPGEGGRYFRELHEADGAFHHARAARAGHGDERLAGLDRQFDSASDFLADHRAHGAADEAELHGAKNDGP